MKITDKLVEFIQRREVIILAFLAHKGLMLALKWGDPNLGEDACSGQVMSLGIHAMLAIFVLRRNTLATYVMAASILYAGLASLYNSLALSLTNPLETLGQNALTLVAGVYFTMSAAVIFRTRKRRGAPLASVKKDDVFINISPVAWSEKGEEKKD